MAEPDPSWDTDAQWDHDAEEGEQKPRGEARGVGLQQSPGVGSQDPPDAEEGEQKANKRKRKKSSNPGAHKRWLQEHTQPDDYTSEYPKWSFWSGKLGWSGFAKSSWDFLDDLHCEAEEKGEACTATLDIGGWLYEITIDPNMEDDDYPEACGYQVAMHSNSKQKRRLISRSY